MLLIISPFQTYCVNAQGHQTIKHQHITVGERVFLNSGIK